MECTGECGGIATRRAPLECKRGRGHHREGEKGRGMRAPSLRAMRAMGKGHPLACMASVPDGMRTPPRA
jgi:hypothetical protein